MNLTVIAMVKDRPKENIDHWARHLMLRPGDYQVILVDQSQTNLNLDNGVICRDLGIRHVYHPQEKMNMSQAFNLGIKMVQSDYVMMTGVDFLFSSNFFEVLWSKVSENRIVNAMAGYLPEGCDLALDWPTLVAIAAQGEISRRLSPGACQCVPWSWAMKVHGYDERFPAQDGVDDDFRCRAIKDGLESVWIEFNEAQSLHMWHERSPLKGVGSELFGDAPVVANPQTWGEY